MAANTYLLSVLLIIIELMILFQVKNSIIQKQVLILIKSQNIMNFTMYYVIWLTVKPI